MIAAVVHGIRNTLCRREQFYNFLHAYNTAERLFRADAYRHRVENNDLVNAAVVDMLAQKPHISVCQSVHIKPLVQSAVERRIRNVPSHDRVICLFERINRTAVEVSSSS